MTPESSITKATRRLQDRGLRLTPQRLMILEAVFESPNHATAEEIGERLERRYPRLRLNTSTIYRTLEALVALGMVTQTDLGQGRVQYHPAEHSHHHHLVCRQCGAIQEVPEEAVADLRRALLGRYGFAADLRHQAFFGECSRCLKAD